MTDHQPIEAPGKFAERLLSLDDLGRLREPPPLYRAADGRPLLYRGTLAQLSGGYGTYKSFIAIDAACSVAAGLATGRTEGVVFIAAEGAAGLRKRILAWCEVHNVDAATLSANLRVHNGAIQLGSPVDMNEVKTHCIENQPALLIVDTRAKCSIGVEENDSTAQGPLIRAVERIVDESGTTVLVIHHTGKNGSDRGTNAWPSGVWSHLVLAKGRKEFTASIECEKHKDAPSGCRHDVQLVRHQLPETAVSPRRSDEADPDYDERRFTLSVAGPGQRPDASTPRDRAAEVVAELDRLEVPQDATYEQARKAGVRARKATVLEAQERRRARGDHGSQEAGNRDDSIPVPSIHGTTGTEPEYSQVRSVPDAREPDGNRAPGPRFPVPGSFRGGNRAGPEGPNGGREPLEETSVGTEHRADDASESGMEPKSGRSLLGGKELAEEEPQGDDGESFAAVRSRSRKGTGPQDDGQDREHDERVPAELGNEAAAGTAPLRSTNPLPSDQALPDKDPRRGPDADARAWELTRGKAAGAYTTEQVAEFFHTTHNGLTAMICRHEARTA